MRKMINEEQFQIMINFMAQHGDLRRFGDVHQREKIKKKWLELITILNKQGEKKTLTQWSKFWSDTKYNTIKKYKNSMKGGPQLTENEKMIIQIINIHKEGIKPNLYDIGDNSIEQELSSINSINELSDFEKSMKEESNTENVSHSQEHPEDSEQVFYVLPSTEERPDSVLSANSSTKSSTAKKRKSSTDSVERLDEIANKFFELERERDRMAHAREMARIKQHSEFLNVMSRLVNVVETLVPSLQKFLDNNTS